MIGHPNLVPHKSKYRFFIVSKCGALVGVTKEKFIESQKILTKRKM